MTAIYLFHPRHGVKVATMEMEAQYDEENGWTRFYLDEMDIDETDAGEPAPAVNLMAAAVEGTMQSDDAPRRRGRPRIHKDD